MSSAKERLAQVEKAIDAIEVKGQRYTIKDRELWRADLKALYAERDKLRRRVSREERGGMRVRRVIPL